MSDKPKEGRITVRIPGDLYAELGQYAKGDGQRPETSLNAAIVFLLRVGLREERKRYVGTEDNRAG